jgi:hypothetical protein
MLTSGIKPRILSKQDRSYDLVDQDLKYALLILCQKILSIAT